MVADGWPVSSYRRLRVPGATRFFTVNLAERGRTTLTDHIDVLRAAYRATVAEHPVFCDAMVVMPVHLHAVWTLPEGDADYSVRWGAIKSRFTMGLRHAERRPGFSLAPIPTGLPVVRSGQFAGPKPGLRVNKRETGVWQRRFWEHMIRYDEDYRNAMCYVIGNPVKHGFVERADDWPYSSVHRDRRSRVSE